MAMEQVADVHVRCAEQADQVEGCGDVQRGLGRFESSRQVHGNRIVAERQSSDRGKGCICVEVVCCFDRVFNAPLTRGFCFLGGVGRADARGTEESYLSEHETGASKTASS